MSVWSGSIPVKGRMGMQKKRMTSKSIDFLVILLIDLSVYLLAYIGSHDFLCTCVTLLVDDQVFLIGVKGHAGRDSLEIR